ncbi:MAG: helix-turn-helix domain-containing protein [Pseudolysinimonas sp.]
MLTDSELDDAVRAIGAPLLERLDELVELANARISSELPSYHTLVPPDDLRASGRNVVGMVLGQLVGASRSDMDGSVKAAVERGRQRQAQGVALEDVLRAVRLDFAILWEPVVEMTRDGKLPAEVSSLAMLRIWESLEGVMLALTEGYRYQEIVADRESLGRRTRAMTALVYEPDMDPRTLERHAEVLGFEVSETLLIIAARLGDRQDSHLEMRWRADGAEAHVLLVGDHVVGLTRWSERNARVLSDIVEGFEDRLAVVVPPVVGIAEAHRAISLARSVLPAAPTGTVTAARDLLVESLVISQPSIATPLSRVLLGPLLDLPPVERERLLETLDGWMVIDGTTTDVAKQLYRHRNTVINHLRRVEEVTGLSTNRPRDIATLVAALTAARSWMPRR